MKSGLLVLLLICSGIYLGCDSVSSPTGDYTIQNVFPMKVGNMWILHRVEYAQDGSIAEEYDDTLSIDSSGIEGGHSGFFFNYSNEGEFVYYSGTDLLRYSVQSDRSTLMLRYPMELNTDLVVRDTAYDGYRSKQTIRLVSKDFQVAAPAGTFNCLKYEMTSMSGPDTAFVTSSMDNVYFAPNIGFIGEDLYSFWPDNTKRLRFSMRLASYTVK